MTYAEKLDYPNHFPTNIAPLLHRLSNENTWGGSASRPLSPNHSSGWHDLCERRLGRQLEADRDLERLQALRDTALGSRGEPERLDRRSTTPPLEVPAELGAMEAQWAVETSRRRIAEFYGATHRERPDRV